MAIINKTIITENIGTHNVTIKQDHTSIKDIMFKVYLVQYITRNFQRQTKYALSNFAEENNVFKRFTQLDPLSK